MAGQLTKSVQLFYDVISPYTWIGFEVLCRYKQRWNIDIVYKPFLVGAVFQAAGNVPPAVNPVRGKYLSKDIYRVADYYQLPLKYPKDFEGTIIKKGSLNAMRLVTVVQQNHPEKIEDINRELFLRVWNQDKDVTQPESLLEASENAGFSSSEAQTLVGKIKDQPVKDQLKQNVQEAIKLGAFGSPTILAQDAKNKSHMIFGSDRFHILAKMLDEKELGPLNELAHPKTQLN